MKCYKVRWTEKHSANVKTETQNEAKAKALDEMTESCDEQLIDDITEIDINEIIEMDNES